MPYERAQCREAEDELDAAAPPRVLPPRGLPPSRALTALQRGAGNAAVTRLLRQEQGSGATAAPLLLTDRPWAEIERERRDRVWGGILPGTQPQPRDGLGLPGATPGALLAASGSAAERDEPGGAPGEPVLLLTDRPWRQHEHEERVRRAREAKARKARARQEEIEAQKRRPRKGEPRTPEDLPATQRDAAEAARTAAIAQREAALALERVVAARAALGALDTEVDGLVRIAAPAPVAASYMTPAETGQLAADLGLATAQLAAIRAHAGVLAGCEAALRLPPVAAATVSNAYAAAATTFDVAALDSEIRAMHRDHLTANAVRAKVQALLDAAKADPARLLGHQATVTILKGHAGKDRARIAGEIAAAVHDQHHPPPRVWLELLQVTKKNAKNGQLRIKDLHKGVSVATGTSIPVHLSVYIDQVSVPAAGVNASVDEVLDAVLPKHRPLGAHVTLELRGPIAPHDNPHFFRGDTAALRNAYASADWPAVEKELIKRMDDELVDLRVRIQRFLDRKGRMIGD